MFAATFAKQIQGNFILPHLPPSFGGNVQIPNTKNIYEETTTTCNFTFKNYVTKATKNIQKNKSECWKETHLKFLHVEHMVWSQ